MNMRLDVAEPSFNSVDTVVRLLTSKNPQLLAVLAVLRLSSVALLYCAAAMAQPAPFPVHTEPTELDGHAVQVDVYRAADGATDAVAIVAHGFTRTRARHRDLGRALAAAGITAVIPDLPYVLDHWGNGDAVVALAHQLEAGALGLPPVQRSRLLLIGTSAGGLATVLAAARLPGLGGWIGLDPVDRTGTGIRAASQLGAPAVVLLAEPSGCNLYGSGRSIADALPNLLRSTLLRGASHCDFEGPTNRFCRVICGESSSAMHTLAQEETVNAAIEMLHLPDREPAPGLAASPHPAGVGRSVADPDLSSRSAGKDEE
jgi:dienelactone hydrolase